MIMSLNAKMRIGAMAVLTILGSMLISRAEASISSCERDAIASCIARVSSTFGPDASSDIHILKFCKKRAQSCGSPSPDERQASFSSPVAPPMPQDTNKSTADLGLPAQRFFLRADPLDNPFPGLTQSATAGQSLGASFGYTQNDFVQTKSGPNTLISSSHNISISGLATYLIEPSMPIGDYWRWVPAIWVSANGNWDNPTKAFGDTSALKLGPKAEFMVFPQAAHGFLNYFDVAPFVQTDFYGVTHAGGVSLGWSPVNPNLFLGEAATGYKPYFVDGFWELRADATNLDVSVPGHTNLLAHDYNWLGGAARVYVFFFPTRGGASWSPYLADRLSFIGTVQSYRDQSSGVAATLYSAALQYKLTCDTKAKGPTNPEIGKKVQGSCDGGSTSLTLQYDTGMDRDTLQEKKMLSAKLNFSF